MVAAALKASVGLLLLLVGLASGLQYEIRGHIDLIQSYDILPEFYNEQSFSEKLSKASDRMAEIVGEDFKSFFVHDYVIHGQDTAVFHARLTLNSNPSVSRQDIIDRIVATEDVQIYFLKKNEVEVQGNIASRFRPVRADVDHCLHGGILLPNATCSCLPYYSGANCEVVTCRNNGIGQNGRCTCPPGLYSAHCEARTCVTKINSVIDFSAQSMILVVNTRTSMGFDLSTIIENIPTLVQDYQNQNIPIASYILTVYRYSSKGKVYFMETNSFTNSADMVDYLSNGVTIAPSTDDQPTLDAINAAQSTQVSMRPKSIVFVFADSENLEDTAPSTMLTNTNESVVIQQTLAWRNKIVMVLSQFPASPISPTGNHFDVLRRVITAVHGDLMIVDKSEVVGVIKELLYAFIGGQNIFVQYYNSVSKTIPILSDSATQTTFALITVESGSIPNVQDKNGKMLAPDVSGKRFALFRVYQSVTDSITITGDTIPVHSTRVWFPSMDDVLISYSDDDAVDNNYAHTFNGFRQRPAVYSSFATTTGLTVTRLNSYNSSIILGAVAYAAKSASCVFNYQLTAESSCIPGPFVHNVVVAATDGNKYRAVPGYCFTPDTHSAPLWSCINNGTRSGVSSCNCATNWDGLHCEVPKCLNGGYPDKFPNGGGHGNCICPFGVTGSFCEIMSCPTTSPDTFQSYNRSFALVVQNSLSANQAMLRLNDGLTAMLNKGQSNDFEDYILTTYKVRVIGGLPVPDVTSTKFSSASAFLNATTDDGIMWSYSPTGTQPGLFALETTLRSMDYDKSSIFFFTDSESSMVEGTLNFTDIVQQAVERQIEISIVIIPPYGSLDLCPADNLFLTYEDLARMTGGNFINLCQPYTTSGDPVFNFIGSYGSTHHHTEVVSYYTVDGCAQFLSRDFFISSATNDAYVTVYSPTIQNFTATIFDIVKGGDDVPLVPDTHSVPFFASFQIKIANGSSLQYAVNIKGSTDGQCFVRVSERSQFSAYLGFSPDPSFDRFSKDLTYATHQQPVIHLSSTLQSEPFITMTSYDIDNNYLYDTPFVKRTSGCKYEYIMRDQFTCQNAGDTFTMETTIETHEVTIMRTQRAFCSDLVGCINGGIQLAGQCQCINGYQSLHCEVPTCQNGGSIVDFKCQCDAKHDGDSCQYTKCNDWNFVETHDPREYNFQQIVFVVEVNTKNMVFPNSFLLKNIQAFVDGTDDINIPKLYTLVTFDDANINVLVSSTQKDVFISAFLNGVTVGINTPAKVKGLEAINTAYSTLLDLPGIIYMFTATDSASNVAAVRQRYGVQVNVVWMGTDLTPTNINYYYSAIARQSNGRLIPANGLQTKQILNALIPTVNENQLILDDAAKDCTAGANFKFPVGSLATRLTLLATGTNVFLTVTDEKNNNVDLTNSSTFTDVNTLIRTINAVGHSGGTWNVNVKSTGNCFLQVRVNSPLQVIPKFTNDQGDDYGSGTPRAGAGAQPASYITFRIMDSYNSDSNNFGSSISVIESADTDPETPWATTSNFKNTTVLTRDPVGCASQFVTPLMTWTSTYMKFVVRGLDSNGNQFQRTFFFNKSGSKSDCQNGATVDSYGFCQCADNYWGNLCQMRRCQNGGQSAYGLCDCPNGYYGNFCEQYIQAA